LINIGSAKLASKLEFLQKAAAMDAHQIGTELRGHVLRDRQSGRALDPRRLQALVADLCGDEQQDLVAPLRYLVFSSTFAKAACIDRPLADGRLLQILVKELSGVFTPTLCTRMHPVIEGLMGMDATPTSTQWRATRPGRSEFLAAKVVLAFLSGVLLMSLALVGLVIQSRQNMPAPVVPDTNTSSPNTTSDERSYPTVPRAAPGQTGNESPTDLALHSIQELYAALSAKDFEKANLHYGSGAADQFTPGFFMRFQRVTVHNLRVISGMNSTVYLEGEVTFVWPDESLQSETRSFRVDTSRNPAQITASEFGRVISPRQ
jgi:hypothetical protein